MTTQTAKQTEIAEKFTVAFRQQQPWATLKTWRKAGAVRIYITDGGRDKGYVSVSTDGEIDYVGKANQVDVQVKRAAAELN